MPYVAVIIPAFNEEQAIVKVLAAIPKHLNPIIIVVNNNSTDKTEKVALEAGATVVTELKQGYGYACLAGIDYIAQNALPIDIIVFLDADYSDYPEEMTMLIAPILANEADLVIGSRNLKPLPAGAMNIVQRFGNWLATRLIKFFYKTAFTDLGPFRAIEYSKLLQLKMKDTTYG